MKAKVSEFEKRRRARVQVEQLRRLTDAVLVFLADCDATLAHRKDIPRDVSSWLGQRVGALENENDAARYFGLRIDFRTDDKTQATAAARERSQRQIKESR